ncbi:MAG: DUF1559 domain-containing protein [Planctomycetia bacterium]|nr:DUF1559 domain-containing protein [Planctomycetia bacterium]
MNPISGIYPRRTLRVGGDGVVNGRTGFTLIELLTVVVIIGMLAGMLMPAAQYAREAARRTQCMNRLRQFGIAMNGYAAMQNGYPAVRPERVRHGWAVELLPHLDVATFVASWDEEKDYFANENARLLQRYMALFHCPSTPDGRRVVSVSNDYYGNPIDTVAGTTSDYYVHCDGILMADGKTYSNILQDTKVTHPNSVADGVSHCIVMNEQGGRNQLYQRGVRVSDGVVSRPYTSVWAAAVTKLPDMVTSAWEVPNVVNVTNESFYSFHPGGVDVLFLDGNVRKVSENVVPYIILAMNTRDGGENVLVDDLELTELDASFFDSATGTTLSGSRSTSTIRVSRFGR